MPGAGDNDIGVPEQRFLEYVLRPGRPAEYAKQEVELCRAQVVQERFIVSVDNLNAGGGIRHEEFVDGCRQDLPSGMRDVADDDAGDDMPSGSLQFLDPICDFTQRDLKPPSYLDP